MEEDGRLFHRDYVLEVCPDEGVVVTSDPIRFWCLTTVTEEEIMAAKADAERQYCCMLQRRALKGKVGMVGMVRGQQYVNR